MCDGAEGAADVWMDGWVGAGQHVTAVLACVTPPRLHSLRPVLEALKGHVWREI